MTHFTITTGEGPAISYVTGSRETPSGRIYEAKRIIIAMPGEPYVDAGKLARLMEEIDARLDNMVDYQERIAENVTDFGLRAQVWWMEEAGML